MLGRYLVASIKFVGAFLRAYDTDGGKSEKGFPLLQEWQSNSPYEKYLRVSEQKEGPYCCGLIFEFGREKAELILLQEGQYQIGPRMNDDIVTSFSDISKPSLKLEVSIEGCFLSSEAEEIAINSSRTKEALLIDQDYCAYAGARFYFLELEAIKENKNESQIPQAS